MWNWMWLLHSIGWGSPHPPGARVGADIRELAAWGSVDVSRYAHRSGVGQRAQDERETNERPERGRVSER
jgi:hypothetical protein